MGQLVEDERQQVGSSAVAPKEECKSMGSNPEIIKWQSSFCVIKCGRHVYQGPLCWSTRIVLLGYLVLNTLAQSSLGLIYKGEGSVYHHPMGLLQLLCYAWK